MLTKLIRLGDAYAILIDKQILDLLNITEETELTVRTDGEQIIIRPVKESGGLTEELDSKLFLKK